MRFKTVINWLIEIHGHSKSDYTLCNTATRRISSDTGEGEGKIIPFHEKKKTTIGFGEFVLKRIVALSRKFKSIYIYVLIKTSKTITRLIFRYV